MADQIPFDGSTSKSSPSLPHDTDGASGMENDKSPQEPLSGSTRSSADSISLRGYAQLSEKDQEAVDELVQDFPDLAGMDHLTLEEQVQLYQNVLDMLQKELHEQGR